MDVMKIKSRFHCACGTGRRDAHPAAADGMRPRWRRHQGYGRAGTDPGARADPDPEGFTYYFRADIGYGWAADNASFSESGSLLVRRGRSL